MTKKQITQKSLKLRARKAKQAEIDKAIKALGELRKQQLSGRQIRTAIGEGTVVVHVMPKRTESAIEGRYYHTNAPAPHSTERVRWVKSGNSSYCVIDQSIVDTERAVRTLNSEPSKKVDEIYKRLARVAVD